MLGAIRDRRPEEQRETRLPENLGKTPCGEQKRCLDGGVVATLAGLSGGSGRGSAGQDIV